MIACGLAVATLAGCAFTSGSSTAPRVSCGKFPAAIKRIHVHHLPATPPTEIQQFGAYIANFPCRTTLVIEPAAKGLDRSGRYYFPAINRLTVYGLPAPGTTPRLPIQNAVPWLKQVLIDRPPSAGNLYRNGQWKGKAYRHLPDYPGANAAHAFQEHLTYLDAEWGSGICYLTQFTQDGGSPANNEELSYVFQGLSKDKRYYLEGTFHVTHSSLPATFDTEITHSKGDYRKDELHIRQLPEASFSPPLPSLREWLLSLRIR